MIRDVVALSAFVSTQHEESAPFPADSCHCKASWGKAREESRCIPGHNRNHCSP